MFGKKRKQAEEDAVKRAEEAERIAREARAEADAIQKQKKGFRFGIFRKKDIPVQEHEAEPAEAATPVAPAQPEETPSAAPVAVPGESRRARKKRESEEKKAQERIADLEIRLNRAEKKRRSARFCDFFAFIVLLAAAVLMLLGPVLKLILEKTGVASEEALRTVSIVAQYCLLAAIALPAWYFVYRKSLGWKIVFFVALAGFIVGNILGLTL